MKEWTLISLVRNIATMIGHARAGYRGNSYMIEYYGTINPN